MQRYYVLPLVSQRLEWDRLLWALLQLIVSPATYGHFQRIVCSRSRYADYLGRPVFIRGRRHKLVKMYQFGRGVNEWKIAIHKGIWDRFRITTLVGKSERHTIVIVVGCLYGSGMTSGFDTLLTWMTPVQKVKMRVEYYLFSEGDGAKIKFMCYIVMWKDDLYWTGTHMIVSLINV